MLDKDAVRRGYDDVAETYAAERSRNPRELDLLEGFLRELPGSPRILDAGCGQGAPILRRASESGAAIGLDLSATQLRLAAENAPGAALVRGDLTALPLDAGSVDAVLAFHSMIHVPYGEHRRAVEEFARVLRPGGRLLLSEGPEEWRGTNPDWLESGVEMSWNIAGAAATREQLRAAGFAVEEERTVVDELAGEDSWWVYFSARLDD